jgi:hypothetical protein
MGSAERRNRARIADGGLPKGRQSIRHIYSLSAVDGVVPGKRVYQAHVTCINRDELLFLIGMLRKEAERLEEADAKANPVLLVPGGTRVLPGGIGLLPGEKR